MKSGRNNNRYRSTYSEINTLLGYILYYFYFLKKGTLGPEHLMMGSNFLIRKHYSAPYIMITKLSVVASNPTSQKLQLVFTQPIRISAASLTTSARAPGARVPAGHYNWHTVFIFCITCLEMRTLCWRLIAWRSANALLPAASRLSPHFLI